MTTAVEHDRFDAAFGRPLGQNRSQLLGRGDIRSGDLSANRRLKRRHLRQCASSVVVDYLRAEVP